MAYRAGFPIALLSITSSGDRPSGIVCDWKGLREIVDQSISGPISDDLREELVSGMSSALDARQTAVAWGVAKAVMDTNPFAHTGYKLASRLLRIDQLLIESLAQELTSQTTIRGEDLRKWLNANAIPLDFDESEKTTTY